MKYIYFFGIFACLSLVECSKSTYDTSESHPTLTVSLLQDIFVIDEPIYLQLHASQKGYKGEYFLSIVADKGECEVIINEQKIATSGEWIALANSSEIITIIPQNIGSLQMSFDLKTGNTTSKERSSINLKVSGSAPLQLTVDAPKVASISKPLEISILTSKKGFFGAILTKYEQLSNTGLLQFGAVEVISARSISLPANNVHKLHYIPSERGTHRLQFTATDGYTTEFKAVEIIVTN